MSTFLELWRQELLESLPPVRLLPESAEHSHFRSGSCLRPIVKLS